MSEVTVTYPKWSEISKRLNPSSADSALLVDALKDFGAQTVSLLSVPYGTQLIRNGSFQWSGLGLAGAMSSEFGTAPIPLGLIVSGAVELYTHSKYSHHVRGHSRGVERTVPVFLLGAGTFFGLFETFAPKFTQPDLWGDAGGTTLVVLPPIGDQEKFARLRSADKGKFLNGVESNEKFVVKSSDIDHLKIIGGSNLSFGPFFAKLLSQIELPWRVELALFPSSFVERIRKKPLAHQALLSETIDQLSLTCERLGLADRLNNDVRDSKDHVLSVSMIAHGYRPGFAPVLETDLDEAVLPAKAIHKLLYEIGICDKIGKDQNDFFPAVFRPSFAGERSYYFLNRPYFRDAKIRKSVGRLVGEITDDANEKNGCSGHFVSTSAAQLQKSLEAAHLGAATAARKICLEDSQFITGGCIAISPIKGNVLK